MTDAGYKAAVEYMRGTVRRWGRGQKLLVGMIGALVMLAVGVIFSAYAAGQGAAPVEGESFTHPPGTEVVTGAQYSGGKALKITSGQALPTKKVTITETSNVLVRARAGQTGGSPTLTIRVDGSNKGTRRITSSVLSDYLYAGIILQPGTYTIGLKGGDLAQGRYVFVDVVRFPAVTPPGGDPPVGVDDSKTVGEDDGATTINVLTNDTDPDGGTKTIASVTQPAHGTVAITNNGNDLTYKPNADYCNGGSPTDDFTYTLNGGSTAKVAVTVTCVNDAPVAKDDSYSTDEDTTLNINGPGVLENDTDVDNANLTAVKVSDPAHGTLTLNDDGSFEYKPNADYNGPDSFTYKANDGTADSEVVTVSITVNAVNDSPTNIALSNASVDENEPAGTTVGTFSTTDPDAGDTHTYALVSGDGDTDNGSFQITDGALKTNEAFDFETKDSYTIRVQADDGNGGTFEKQFTISITNANDDPTDIALSNSSVAENQPSGTTVGTLSTTDPDSGETHTYSLVTGDGDSDNGSFQITGDMLQTNEEFDFEAKDSYTVRVRTDDGNGGTFEKQFTISITNANDDPTDIALSNSSVAENQPSGTTVGTFSSTDQDSADTHTYSLVSGAGSEDNGSFQITDGTLKTNEEFDFETKDSYSVRVQSDDGNGGTFEKQLTISITNANDAPTDIALSNSSVAENQPAGTDVGTFSTTDQDSGDTHTYTLVTGTGDTDNGSFQISGDTLQTKAQFDFETKDSYSVQVKTDDGNGGTFEKQLTISITNANDAPTDIALSNSSVAENQPSGTTIGTLSTTDEDTADTHTYTLVSGTGDTDNAKFQISGSALQTNEVFDFETKSSYSVRIKTDDGNGGTFEKQLTITVTNANDAPTDIALSKSDIDENRPSGTAVGNFSTTDQDTGDTHTYALVSGTGSTDNGQFQIVGGELRTNASFNFEVKNSYSIRVSTTDNGSPAKSFEEAFTISINDVNDAPVATADSYSGAIGNTLASRGVTVSGEPVVALTGNVITNNDTDEDQPAQPLSAVAETVSSTGGGTATIKSDGSFTFLPGVGVRNQNDTFTYRVTDGTATASGTVTVGIANALVWYVDNAKATNGDGRSSSPLNSLGGINAAGGTGDSDRSDDILFLYQGSGNYTGGLPLEANQQLLGQPNGLTVNNGASNVTLVSPSGSNPTITNSSGNGITLTSGNTIRSLNVGNASGSGILGNSFGTLDIGSVGVNTTGQALNLTTGTLAGSGFTGVSSSGGTNNVLLSGVGTGGSTFALGSGTLSGASSDAFKVVGSGSFSYSGNVSQANSGAALVSVSGGHNGTLTFGTGTLSATGGTGLQFDNADGTYNFNGTTTLNGGDAGVDILNGSTGTFSFGTGTTITNPSGTGFNLSGATASNATVTYSGNISKNNAGPAINIDNHDANTITFQTGTLSSTGTSSGIRVQNSNGGQVNFNQPTKTLNTGTNAAVALSTNTGGTMNFGGGSLDIDTTSGAGFSATGGGTVTVQGSSNTIDSTSATALNVTNTTIGASGLTFQRISSGNNTPAASDNPANGIVLNTTGSSGGLTVTGGGNTSVGGDDSGGIIQNTTSYGISLTNTTSPSFTNMNIHDTGRNGIDGTGVVNFTFVNSKITTTGNSGPDQYEQNSIAFVESAANPTTNTLSGTVTITQNTISDPRRNAIMIETWNGTISNLNISTNTITGGTTNGDILDAIHVFTQGSTTTTSNLTTGTIQNNTISGFRFLSGSIYIGGNGIRVAGGSGNASNTTSATLGTLANPIVISGNDVDDGGSNAIAVSFNGEQGTSNFTIRDNGTLADPMSNMEGLGISAFFGGTGNFTALVHNNVIDTNGPTVHAGSAGIGVQMDTGPSGSTSAAPQVKYTVSNNTVKHPDGNGIIPISINNSGTMNLKLTNNNVTEVPFLPARYGIRVAQNNATSGTICLDMTGNDTAGGSGITGKGIGVRRNAPLVFGVVGLPAGSTASPQFEAYIDSQNPLGNGSELISATSGFSSCTLPSGMPTP